MVTSFGSSSIGVPYPVSQSLCTTVTVAVVSSVASVSLHVRSAQSGTPTAISMPLPARFTLIQSQVASYAPPSAISCFSSAVGFTVASSVAISSIHQPFSAPTSTVALFVSGYSVSVVSFGSTALPSSSPGIVVRVLLSGPFSSSLVHAVKHTSANIINISFFIITGFMVNNIKFLRIYRII